MRESKKQSPLNLRQVRKLAEQNKVLLLVLLLGLGIILWPARGGGREEMPVPEQTAHPLAFSLEEKETRIANALSQIEGAGDVVVVLSLRTSLEQEVAVDEDSGGRRATVTIAAGSGVQSEVTLRYRYPEFRGALIVSEGAVNATVRLQITQAVAALTGLGTDRITVTQMGSGVG